MIKNEYRVFTKHLGWSECMYLFPKDISFKSIKNNPGTNILTKYNYLGLYELDDKFISYFQVMKIDNLKYYVKFSYDNEIEEEKEETLF